MVATQTEILESKMITKAEMKREMIIEIEIATNPQWLLIEYNTMLGKDLTKEDVSDYND